MTQGVLFSVPSFNRRAGESDAEMIARKCCPECGASLKPNELFQVMTCQSPTCHAWFEEEAQ